jgi:hypothetical protein
MAVDLMNGATVIQCFLEYIVLMHNRAVLNSEPCKQPKRLKANNGCILYMTCRHKTGNRKDKIMKKQQLKLRV